jgi:WD40 repeat protein
MPGAGPMRVFADRLVLLRRAAGQPTYESIERGVALSIDPRRLDQRGRPVRAPSYQRIGAWVNGENVPSSWPQCELVLRFLIEDARRASPHPAVQGLYGLTAWEALWKAARKDPGEALDVCPYRGLEAFHQEHASHFFGRGRSTDDLVRRLAAALCTGGLLMLVGPSGVGKSSLCRAGLLPALHKNGVPGAGSATWRAVVITPGEDPVRELVACVPGLGAPLRQEVPDPSGVRAAIAAHAERQAGPGTRLVIVVDQFEEVFTLCAEERERCVFIEALQAAAAPAAGGGAAPALVVVGVRADFYGRCLAYPGLADALRERQMVLSPMTAEELAEAVTGPADSVGLRWEPGLVELLLHDAGLARSPASAEAGVLPLLSHALAATWERRKKGVLTTEGYRAAGGIRGAVEASAEKAWAELDADGQRAGLGLLLRLTRIGGDGAQDTRGRVAKRRLLEQARDRARAEAALEVLAGARLVSLDAESVQLAHEAVLYAWPRLRLLLDEHREALLLRQRVEEDAAGWDNHRHDPSQLYRGARLENAQRWAEHSELDGPSDTARAFLAASHRAHRRHTWAVRAGIAAVVVLALVAGVAAVLARNQRDAAMFTAVVAEADRLQGVDPSLSAQLDLLAHRMDPDDHGVDGRILSTQDVALATPLVGDTGSIYTTSFSPDGRTLATASIGSVVRLWDVADAAHPAPLGTPLVTGTRWADAAVFSPDGRTLASSDGDGTIRLWNVTDRARPTPLAPPMQAHDGATCVAFSPDGRTLASGGRTGAVRLWNVADLAHPTALGPPLPAHSGYVQSVAFSPRGNLLATGGDDHTARLWDVTDPRHPEPAGGALTEHTGVVFSVAFSPDGRTLATGSYDKTARRWDVADPAHPAPLGAPLPGGEGGVFCVAFSPDGHTLVTGSGDGTARLWNVADPPDAQPIGAGLPTSNGGIPAVAFSPDGHTLATGGSDGTTMLWSLPTTVLVGHDAGVGTVAFSPDGRTLASGSTDGTFRLWDVADPARPTALGPPVPGTGYVSAVTFSAKGGLLATKSHSGDVQLWDVTDPRHVAPLGRPVAQHTTNCDTIAFSPGERVLATCDTDETVQLWSIADAAHLAPLGPHLLVDKGYVSSVEFSPDGRTLATAGKEGTVRRWDVHDPAHARSLGLPLNPRVGPIESTRFSPDGRILAAAGQDKTIRRWDVTDPAHPVALPPLVGHTQPVHALAFSPDGRVLASGGVDRTARRWDVSDPAHPAADSEALTGHTGTIYSVAFSPSGRTLATGSEDDTIMLWDLDVDHAIQRICATTRGALTPGRWHQLLPRLPYSPPC